MFLVLASCAPEPVLPTGPTARERFAPIVTVSEDSGVPSVSGWPPPSGGRRARDVSIVALEGGRWATWRADDRSWILWDPERGQVHRVEGRALQPPNRDDQFLPHGEARRADQDRGVPTPDGAWIIGKQGAARLDPERVVTSRLVHVTGGAIAWGPEVGAWLDVPPGGARSPDGTLDAALPTPPDPTKPTPVTEGLKLVGSDGTVGNLGGCISPESVGWSADNTRLACLTGDGLAVFDRRGRRIAAWAAVARGFRPERVSLSRDGRLLALTEADGRIAGWRVDEDDSWTATVVPGAAAITTDDGSLVVVSDGAGLAVFDAADGTRLTGEGPPERAEGRPRRVPPTEPTVPAAPAPPPRAATDGAWRATDPYVPVYRVRWDGDTIVAGNDHQDLRVAPDGAVTLGPPTDTAPPELPDGMGADDLQVWFPLIDGTLVRLPIPGAVTLAASARHVAIVSGPLGVLLVDRTRGELVQTLLSTWATRARNEALGFSADGERLAYASLDLHAWRVADGAELYGPPRGPIVSLAMAADGSAIGACTRSGAAIRIDVDSPEAHELATEMGEGCRPWFDGDRLVFGGSDGPRAVFSPDGTAQSVATPWRRGVAGLSLDDTGHLQVLSGGSAYEVGDDGEVRRVGPEVQGAAWRLALGQRSARWMWPGRSGFPSGAPVCGGRSGLGCSTVPTPTPSKPELGRVLWVAPSPTGEWFVAQQSPGVEVVATGSDGTELRVDGPLAVAWASPDMAVVAGPGTVGTWRMGAAPSLVPAAASALPVTAAGGDRQARLYDRVLLVGPQGTDAVDCVLPGGTGTVVLSPDGRTVAWMDRNAHPWLADVDRCVVTKRPVPPLTGLHEPHRSVFTGGRLTPGGDRASRFEGAVALVGESMDGRWVATTRGPPGQITLWQNDPPVAFGTFERGGSSSVVIDPKGLVAWLDSEVLSWWSPGGTVREAAWLGPVEQVLPHSASGLVVAGRGVVRVVSPATLVDRSVAPEPRDAAPARSRPGTRSPR